MAKLRSILLLLFTCTLFNSAAQELLTGWVIDQKEKETIPSAHVVNKNTLKGTMTDSDGYFEIELSFGDTIVFSNIAYQYFYFIYNDTASELKEVIIKMKEQNYLLDEVRVTSYKLTSNKPREIRLNKPKSPSTKQLRSDYSMLSNQLESGGWMYELLSSKAEQLARLRQLQIEDAYRQRLEVSNNRESVIKLTGLSKDELQSFMFYCKFAPIQMHSMNDYQFLRSVQGCFQKYIEEKELEGFLEQFD